jgi:diguanylate cyclase (GGDEF)-like protein
VARIGGDEFVIVVSCGPGRVPLADVADRILSALRTSISVTVVDVVNPVKITASIGMALSDGRPASELLHEADTALYRAKRDGKDRIGGTQPSIIGPGSPVPASPGTP